MPSNSDISLWNFGTLRPVWTQADLLESNARVLIFIGILLRQTLSWQRPSQWQDPPPQQDNVPPVLHKNLSGMAWRTWQRLSLGLQSLQMQILNAFMVCNRTMDGTAPQEPRYAPPLSRCQVPQGCLRGSLCMSQHIRALLVAWERSLKYQQGDFNVVAVSAIVVGSGSYWFFGPEG